MRLDSEPEFVEDWAQHRDRTAGHRAELAEEAYGLVDDLDPPPGGAPDPEVVDAGVDPPWEISSDGEASWALRKIAEASVDLERLQGAAEFEIARYQRWLAEASEPLTRRTSFFTSKLIEYRRRLEDENPDLALTYKLPDGALVRRAGRAKTTVTDEDAFCAWAIECAPDALALRPLTSSLTRSDRFEVSESGALVEVSTGEVVPGVQVSVGSPSYGVKVR